MVQADDEVRVEVSHDKCHAVQNTTSLWCPDSMIREVAEDATASIEYDENIPRAFGQPHVEAAFQAQLTETRLAYVTYICGGAAIFFLAQSIQRVFGLAPGKKFDMPVSFSVGAFLLFSSLSVAMVCSGSKLRERHHLTRRFSNAVCFLFTAIVTVVSMASVLNGVADCTRYPYNTGYSSGIVLASSVFCLAIMEASFWTFLATAAYAIVTCSSPDADWMAAVLTVPVGLVLASVARQILLQHRASFVAEVMTQELLIGSQLCVIA